jgi:hypothetical protein
LFVAYSTDELGCPVELREVTLPDTLTDQTIDLVFDGSNPAAPETFEVTLQLPDDPSSLFNTEGPNLDVGRFPFAVFDDALRMWGGSCNKRPNLQAGTIDLTLSYFAKDDGDLIFAAGVWPGDGNASATNPASEHWFGRTSPGPGTYQVLDIPVLSSPAGSPNRSSTFSWQPIEGATRYALELSWAESYPGSLWVAQSWRHQDIVLPALPAGYDATAEWGSGSGRYRAIACNGWDQHFLTSPLGVAAAHPEWACGMSAPMSGPILE